MSTLSVHLATLLLLLPLSGWEQGAHLVLVFGGLGKAVRMSSSRFEGGHV